MNNFTRLYSVYESASRWFVIKMIYKQANVTSKCGMWASKLLLIILISYAIRSGEFTYTYWAMIATMILWSWFFVKGRKIALCNFYTTSDHIIRLYERNYQYIRYMIFKSESNKAALTDHLDDALKHINIQLETDGHNPVTNHPLITILLGLLFAIIGGASGRLEPEQFINIAMPIIVIIYFSYMTLGALPTSTAKIKEFKRFLLWLKEESRSA